MKPATVVEFPGGQRARRDTEPQPILPSERVAVAAVWAFHRSAKLIALSLGCVALAIGALAWVMAR